MKRRRSKLEKIMNRPLVRRLFAYYATRGSRYIDEMFGGEKVKSPLAFLGRVPVRIALNLAMKKIGLDEKLKNLFFSAPWNSHTLLNVIGTVARNGLSQPFRFDAPPVVVWNYTNLCNLRCRYCYQSAGARLEDELSFEKKIDLVDQMVASHVGFLAFSGGEPVMGPGFWEVCGHASRSLNVSVATNGILVSDVRMAFRLADHGVRNVFVSLDGAAASSHDFIRGEGSFAKTVKGIENLVAASRFKVGVNTVVTRRNVREVPGILELALALGVNSFSHYNFIPTGRGKDDFENDLLPDEREELLNLLYDWFVRSRETHLAIVSTSPNFARVIHERSKGASGSLFHLTTEGSSAVRGIIEYAGGCGAGRVYAAVQPNGLVTPCVFMPQVVIGDARKERFIDIWRNSEICRRMVDRESYSGKCPKYLYICGGCRARAYAYGDLLGDDPGCAVYRENNLLQAREALPAGGAESPHGRTGDGEGEPVPLGTRRGAREKEAVSTCLPA